MYYCIISQKLRNYSINEWLLAEIQNIEAVTAIGHCSQLHHLDSKSLQEVLQVQFYNILAGRYLQKVRMGEWIGGVLLGSSFGEEFVWGVRLGRSFGELVGGVGWFTAELAAPPPPHLR